MQALRAQEGEGKTKVGFLVISWDPTVRWYMAS